MNLSNHKYIVMRRVVINAGKIGLVFKRGNYKSVITEGEYWLPATRKVMQYDMTKPFISPIALNILLKDNALVQHLNVVEVMDNEIALQYENGNFKTVLTPGRYAFWNGVTEYSFVKVDLNNIEILENIEKSILQKPEVLKYVRVYVVESYENGLLLIDGEFVRMLEPEYIISGIMQRQFLLRKSI
jgi:hypothetical protein